MINAVFVTSNRDKAREAREILGVDIKTKHLELNELQSMDLDVIIRHKLEQAWQVLKQPVMVEDTGIFFDDWGGFPGPFAKHLIDTMTYDKVAELLGPTRRIHWRVKTGYKDQDRLFIGTGEITGRMAPKRQGESWGFDPFFIPDGYNQTYAEMGPEEKHRISARAQALQDLKRQLGEI